MWVGRGIYTWLLWEKQKDDYHADLCVGGSLIIKCMCSRGIGYGGTVWIKLAPDKDQWPAHVYTVAKLWIP
jgi:hypothetical protein